MNCCGAAVIDGYLGSVCVCFILALCTRDGSDFGIVTYLLLIFNKFRVTIKQKAFLGGENKFALCTQYYYVQYY